MSKRVLIISPYFPPTNSADMQRVRMSLPYFEQFGWEAEVVTVDPLYADQQKDILLTETVPANVPIHYVKAFNKKWTSKIGLGSIALRSYLFYRKKVNSLLKQKKFDLIYFSTTQFPVCALGAYWKKRFKVPYVIDMQDPWHSDYYKYKPKQQRPSKYWFSYRLNKYLEPIAMKQVSGLISVSESYITDLKKRYTSIKNIPSAVITFGSFEPDLVTAQKHKNIFQSLLIPAHKNIVYVGRGGVDMHQAITPLFKALKTGLVKYPELYGQFKFYFIGTSYATNGKGTPSILPLAKQLGIENYIIEITDRIGYFHALTMLQNADALFIPGSDDPQYTASKIYPYLLTKKPLLALFHSGSPANQVLKEYGAGYVYNYDTDTNVNAHISNFLTGVLNNSYPEQKYNPSPLKKYSAQSLTGKQCYLFTQAINE